MATLASIKIHLEAQYDAWAALIYPAGRSEQPATIIVEESDRSSGYHWDADLIAIYVPDGNLDDLCLRLGEVITSPAAPSLTVSEIELLHEMMHERQRKVTPVASDEGRLLCERFRTRFDGPGHDERFFTAIADSAVHFGMAADALVLRL